MKMNDSVYKILSYVALIILPAVATLYFALSGIWGWPYGEQIVGSITAIDAFLGAALGVSNAAYKKSTPNE